MRLRTGQYSFNCSWELLGWVIALVLVPIRADASSIAHRQLVGLKEVSIELSSDFNLYKVEGVSADALESSALKAAKRALRGLESGPDQAGRPLLSFRISHERSPQCDVIAIVVFVELQEPAELHRQVPPLNHPGEKDVTSWWNFEQLFSEPGDLIRAVTESIEQFALDFAEEVELATAMEARR